MEENHKKRMEHLRNAKIGGGELEVVSYLNISEAEFYEKIALLEPEEREIAIEFRQRKLDEQLIQKISQAEKSYSNQLPLEVITLLEELKNRLLSYDLKGAAN